MKMITKYYLMILLVMRNSVQLMRSLGKWQKRKTMTIQTRMAARLTSLCAEVVVVRWDLTWLYLCQGRIFLGIT